MTTRPPEEFFFVEVDGEKFEVRVSRRGGELFAFVNGEEIHLDPITRVGERLQQTMFGGKLRSFGKTQSSDGWTILIDGDSYDCSVSDERSARYASIVKKSAAPKSQVIKAPMPGLIVTVLVKPGQEVRKDQTLLTLSAMKLENDIRANASGIVGEVFAEPNMAVEKGQKLVVIEPCP